MADSKITALTSISTSTDPANDPLVIVDVSDTSMAASGTTKKVTLNNLLACSPTATLASATITGDLTVDTSTLKVDSGANKVGVGTTTMNGVLTVKNTSVLSDIPIYTIQGATNTAQLASWTINQNTDVISFGTDYGGALSLKTNSSERYRLASDGVATWSNVGGVAGTAMTLNATGLGVGASPLSASKLTLNGGTGDTSSQDSIFSLIRTSSTGNVLTGKVVLAQKTTDYGNIVFRIKTTASSAENPAYYTDALTIDGEKGNVGIGVTPSAWASGNKFIDINSSAAFGAFGSSDAMMIGNAYWNGSSWIRKTANNAWRFVIESVSSTPTMTWQLAANGSAGSSITWTQAMTLTAAGDLLVGQTTAGVDASGGLYLRNSASSGGSSILINHRTGVATGNSFAEFFYNGNIIGNILQSGTTGVTFNSVSDYRLKESVQPLVGGLARISALKPSIYKWKTDGSNGEGFLAHELAEVVPFAVTGEKDAVNEDGSIKPQGVDLSKVVPVLVAAIQELAAEVNALKNA